MQVNRTARYLARENQMFGALLGALFYSFEPVVAAIYIVALWVAWLWSIKYDSKQEENTNGS